MGVWEPTPDPLWSGSKWRLIQIERRARMPDRWLNENVIQDSSPNNGSLDVLLPAKHFDSSETTQVDLLSRSRSLFRLASHRGKHADRKASHTRSRRTRRCLNGGLPYIPLVVPATCSPSFRLQHQDLCRCVESARLFGPGCGQVRLILLNQNRESSRAHRS